MNQRCDYCKRRPIVAIRAYPSFTFRLGRLRIELTWESGRFCRACMDGAGSPLPGSLYDEVHRRNGGV